MLSFIELHPFTRRWRHLGLDDDVLDELQMALMSEPLIGPVIRGTGGLRKMRFSPPRWRQSKRDALRVCYVHFPEYHLIILAIVYAKNERDNLSDQERSQIKNFIERQKAALERGRYW